VEVAVEGAELRDDVQEHHEDEPEHHREEHDRVDRGRDGLLPERLAEPQVGGEAAEHGVEVPRPLAGHEARPEDRRVEVSLLPDRVGERHPRLDLVAYRDERSPEDGVALALEHDVERLEQGQAGLQERGHLLGEDQEERRLHPWPPQGERPQREPAPDREQVQPLLLELGPQRALVGSLERSLHDLPRRGADPADVFHRGRDRL
jgi:hypothetical protein